MLKIAPRRTVKVTHQAEEGKDDGFEITVRLAAKEELDFEQMAKLRALYPEGSESANYNVYLYLLRSSIIDCEGILTEEGEKPDLTQPDIQKAVFDAVWLYEDIRESLKVMIGGVSEKN